MQDFNEIRLGLIGRVVKSSLLEHEDRGVPGPVYLVHHAMKDGQVDFVQVCRCGSRSALATLPVDQTQWQRVSRTCIRKPRIGCLRQGCTNGMARGFPDSILHVSDEVEKIFLYRG